jgi:hypothetical protein
MPGTFTPKEGENIHVTAPDWTKSDDDGKLRYIVLDKEQGIKALYNVTKSKIVTYLFDVDKWTETKANAWVKEKTSKAENEGCFIIDAASLAETILSVAKQAGI